MTLLTGGMVPYSTRAVRGVSPLPGALPAPKPSCRGAGGVVSGACREGRLGPRLSVLGRGRGAIDDRPDGLEGLCRRTDDICGQL